MKEWQSTAGELYSVGQKPEVPGYCVKEKDLEECTTHSDCYGVGGGRCVALGRTGERYCLPRSTETDTVPLAAPKPTGDLGIYMYAISCQSINQSINQKFLTCLFALGLALSCVRGCC